MLEQSKRHAFIASLLRIPHLVVCINKMDLVDYDETVYERIVDEFSDFASRLAVTDIVFIPISALNGDNVVDRSENMPWYEGPPLLYHLEHVHIASDRNLADVRFPVQWVIRPQSAEHPDYRGYAGQVAGGILRPGSPLVALPSGRTTRVKAIDSHDGELDHAFPTMSVSVLLEDDLDVSRGDMLCGVDGRPAVVRELEADVCWMAEEPLREGGRYALKHTTNSVRALVDTVEHVIDVHTLAPNGGRELELNDIGRIHLRLSAPLVIDPYERNRTTGSFILVDETTNDTVAAGMIVGGRG